jgi:hypothetical protein
MGGTQAFMAEQPDQVPLAFRDGRLGAAQNLQLIGGREAPSRCRKAGRRIAPPRMRARGRPLRGISGPYDFDYRQIHSTHGVALLGGSADPFLPDSMLRPPGLYHSTAA